VAGGGNPAPQTLQLSNPSNQTLTVSATVAYVGAAGWLSTSASGGTVTARAKR
jgi:hypothetical protein